MVGPTIQQELFLTLFLFRLYRHALTADIVKMDRQFLEEGNDRFFQPDQMSSALFLAIRCLTYIADLYENCYSLREGLYVDDLLTGANSVEELESIKHELAAVLSYADLHLAKLSSNCSQLIEKPSREIPIKTNDENVTKALGMAWKPVKDEIRLNFEINECSTTTKRTISSNVAKIYAVLGLLSPVTIRCKILLQELWIQQLN